MFVLALAVSLPGICFAAPQCSKQAVAQAKKLLSFHVDGDDRAWVEPSAKELPSIRNPAKKGQVFSVLEVQGAVYKGQYTMRLIYFKMGRECVLMGQEILEHAAL